MQKIKITWSQLLPLTKDAIYKLLNVSGVYRLSKKQDDGKYYVFFVGSTENIKEKLLFHINTETDRIKAYIAQGSCSFRYAPVSDNETREAIERQLYKHYLPELNSEEPKSALDIEANLN